MQVNISGHQLDVTDALRDYVVEKLGRLELRCRLGPIRSWRRLPFD